MAARVSLKAYFRPLRRSRDTVQLGLSAESGAIILSGLTEAEIGLLERLDGSLSEARLYASAIADGVDRTRAELLVALLRRHGVLHGTAVDRVDLGRIRPPRGDEPSGHTPVIAGAGRADLVAAWRDRDRRFVVVDGDGRLPWEIARVLRSGGTGRVEVGAWAADLLDAELRDGAGSAPDLVVLVAAGAVDARAGEPWRRRGIAHLPVAADGDRVVVGPLVTGDQSLPCLGCVQLARSDRDAEWPTLAAQQSARADPLQVDATLVPLISGVVAMVVQAYLGGDQVPEGVSIEASLPWPRLDHRRWSRHPGCADHIRRLLVRPPVTHPEKTRHQIVGSTLRGDDPRVTMTT